MAPMTSKMPMAERPLIQDPDLAKVIEDLLAPYEGKKLERAQAAVRKVAASAVQGTFDVIVAAFREAIEAAVGTGRERGDQDS